MRTFVPVRPLQTRQRNFLSATSRDWKRRSVSLMLKLPNSGRGYLSIQDLMKDEDWSRLKQSSLSRAQILQVRILKFDRSSEKLKLWRIQRTRQTQTLQPEHRRRTTEDSVRLRQGGTGSNWN